MFLDDSEVLRWAFRDDHGEPVDLTGAAVAVLLTGPAEVSASAVVLAPGTDGKVEVAMPTGFFAYPGDYTGRWQITLPTGQVSSVVGVVVRVYDPRRDSLLYANLLDLEGLVGDVDDVNLALLKLEAATSAVKGYLTVPLDPAQPIPDRVRQATALIAAQLYVSPVSGAGSERIASEAIGDYKVSYQRESTSAGFAIAGDLTLTNLLAPWHPRIVNAYIGPGVDDDPLPVTYADADVRAWEAAALPEGGTMILDFSPTTLDIEGVRAGDQNARLFTLTSGGVAMNLTDAVLTAEARRTPQDISPSLTAEIGVLDPLAGQFLLSWPGDQVAELLSSSNSWNGVWDLQVLPVGAAFPTTVLEGAINCVTDVTR